MKKEAESYLRTKERGFLATMGKKGPTVIPVCFAYESGKIYSAIDRKPKSGRGLARVKNIERNPRVAFLLDTYSDDWRRLSYLLVHGRASLVRDPGEEGRAKELLLSKYPQYRWLGLVGSRTIRVTIESLKFWKFQARA